MRLRNALTIAAALLCCSALAAAAPKKPGPPTAALKALAAGKGDCKKLVASYTDGSGFHGYTRVKVRDGQIAIEHTSPRHRKVLRYKGELSPQECRALAQQAVAHKLWTVRSKRKTGVPDETRPTISMAVGKKSFSVTLWANEARGRKGFGAVGKLLLGLARRVSQGTVTY